MKVTFPAIFTQPIFYIPYISYAPAGRRAHLVSVCVCVCLFVCVCVCVKCVCVRVCIFLYHYNIYWNPLCVWSESGNFLLPVKRRRPPPLSPPLFAHFTPVRRRSHIPLLFYYHKPPRPGYYILCIALWCSCHGYQLFIQQYNKL